MSLVAREDPWTQPLCAHPTWDRLRPLFAPPLAGHVPQEPGGRELAPTGSPERERRLRLKFSQRFLVPTATGVPSSLWPFQLSKSSHLILCCPFLL